jgi:uncharacterized caspase-like protein
MPNRIALLIGNGTYDDAAFRALARPATDVEALSRVLADPSIGEFDEVVPLIDADCNTIRKAVAGLYKKRSSGDVLLMFYAGHGVKDDFGELHLVTRDTVSDELSATAIASSFISREMDRSRSLNQILILDCCFSGAFAGARAAQAGSVGARESFQGNGTGRVILTASDAFEFAWEEEEGVSGPNSVFTKYLVQGLEQGEADRDCDGLVTVDEWYDYVYDEMQRSAKRQTPHRTVTGSGRIRIAKSLREPIDLPPELMTSIKSAFPRVRQGVAESLAEMLFDNDPAVARTAREHLKRMRGDRNTRVRNVVEALIEGRAPEKTPMFTQLPKLQAAPPPPLPAPKSRTLRTWLAAVLILIGGIVGPILTVGSLDASGDMTNDVRALAAVIGAIGIGAAAMGIAMMRTTDSEHLKRVFFNTAPGLAMYVVFVLFAFSP